MIALARAVRVRGRSVWHWSGPFSTLCRKKLRGKRSMSQERTTVATNELDAPFVREERMIKLVGILGTQAIHSFISVANESLWPIVNSVPLLFQFSTERRPWESIFRHPETDLACVQDGQPTERGSCDEMSLTKHGDEFSLYFIDLASLFRVPVGCGTKYRGRRPDLRAMPVVECWDLAQDSSLLE